MAVVSDPFLSERGRENIKKKVGQRERKRERWFGELGVGLYSLVFVIFLWLIREFKR